MPCRVISNFRKITYCSDSNLLLYLTHNVSTLLWCSGKHTDFAKLFFVLQRHATMTDANSVSLLSCLPSGLPLYGFCKRRIVADETKYHYVVGALNQATASRLVDFLSHPTKNTRNAPLTTTVTIGEPIDFRIDRLQPTHAPSTTAATALLLCPTPNRSLLPR